MLKRGELSGTPHPRWCRHTGRRPAWLGLGLGLGLGFAFGFELGLGLGLG